MKRFLWAFAAFSGLGAACFLAYLFFSPRVEAPIFAEKLFLLVPAGWIFGFAGGICLLAGFAHEG